MSKLALGTAQFGLDYGINNARGKIPSDEAFRILDAAHLWGIDTVDTAGVYGESERTIGDYLRNGGKPFRIVSKTKGSSEDAIRSSLTRSLEALGVRSLYACLAHDFEAVAKNPSAWRTMESLKEGGTVDKVGFSLYFPSELNWILDHRVAADIVQIPISVLDQRFLPVLERAKSRGMEIYARSVFLQGLVFKEAGGLGPRFSSIGGLLNDLRSLSARADISLSRLCLGFVAQNPLVDRVVVGVDGLAHLEELVAAHEIPCSVIGELGRFRINDERMLLPFRWDEKSA